MTVHHQAFWSHVRVNVNGLAPDGVPERQLHKAAAIFFRHGPVSLEILAIYGKDRPVLTKKAISVLSTKLSHRVQTLVVDHLNNEAVKQLSALHFREPEELVFEGPCDDQTFDDIDTPFGFNEAKNLRRLTIRVQDSYTVQKFVRRASSNLLGGLTWLELSFGNDQDYEGLRQITSVLPSCPNLETFFLTLDIVNDLPCKSEDGSEEPPISSVTLP